MAKPFKFRYVNEITGGFVLLTLVLVIVGIILAGNAQRWFEPVHQLTLTFPPEGSFDLQKGAEVRILGALVGTVESIAVDEAGGMTGEITIRGNFIRFVRVDSKAIAKKKFGVAGDAFVEITKGVGAQLEEGAVLACEKDTELMAMVQDVVQQIRTNTVPAIQQVQKAVEEYTKVAEELHRPEGNLQQLLSHLNGLAAGLEKGEGTAGQLLRDPSLANELREITAKVNASLQQVSHILANVEQITAALRDETGDMPGLVLQGRETLRESEKLIEGLQKHWLLRKYVEADEPTARVPASAVIGLEVSP
ncbi:MAG TPA: MlaD family protein [Kiritimatiellia bacterium]|nr:MlaD family protein [Kiritimatiellia bacterium]HRZ13223.1 MlaD family protein [Kiritimatiellia bacterium]HSA18672.1 MlaD family protein [Kiritimatiellia bacterium]